MSAKSARRSRKPRKTRAIADFFELGLPTLVRKLSEPIRKLVGDLSDTERALVGLDLRPRPPGKS